jgi:hypothetical protein
MVIMNSCIEIDEKISVNADGSGRFEFSIDMGSLASAMNSQNTAIDVSMIEKIKQVFAGAQTNLKGADGIANVKSVSDDKNGKFSVGFDFSRSSALNKAIYKLVGQDKKMLFPSLFKISKHNFRKKDLCPYIQKAFKNKASGSLNEMLYSLINYNCTYIFPSDVKKARNIKSKFSDTKTVTMSFTLQELIKGDFNAGNDITF